MSYGANMTAEHILRAHEEMDSRSHQFEGSNKAMVRKVATEVLELLGHRVNVEDIRLDNKQWQIAYSDSLSYKDRKLLEQLIAEELELSTARVKLVGIGF